MLNKRSPGSNATDTAKDGSKGIAMGILEGSGRAAMRKFFFYVFLLHRGRREGDFELAYGFLVCGVL